MSLIYSLKDSDTNPNTTASSIAGDAMQTDGRKRRSEATQLRKSVFGKKHNRLDESKVREATEFTKILLKSITYDRKTILLEGSAIF